MKRREFITLLGGAAAAWPLVAHAQQPATPVIGFLAAVSPDSYSERLRGFRQGLKDTGYVEGENVAIEYRWAENQFDRLPALASDLVRRQVAVIAAVANAAALAVKATTTTIPIVFLANEDPGKVGFLASHARPGGNATGINFYSGELTAKRLELLREVVPAATRVAVLVNPTNPLTTESTLRDVQSAARAMGLQIQVGQRQHQPRDQCGLCNICARATRRAFRRRRRLFKQPACPTGQLSIALHAPRDIFEPRLC
jgi:putative ABC transport system substrate-binding protein